MANQRTIGRAAACALAAAASSSGGRILVRSGAAFSYQSFIGQVANRCGFMNLATDGATYMSTTFHRILSIGGVTGIGIDTVNAYTPSQAGASETAGVSGATIKASVEYNGVITPILHSGSAAAATVAPGTRLKSDLTPINLPYGADIKIHQRRVNLPSYDDTLGQHRAVAFGDAVELTSTDKTLTGGVTDGGSHHSCFPSAIWGYTTTPSFCSFGDSIAAGQGDVTVDATGQQGIFARALGMTLPNLHVAIAGDGIARFNISGTLRRAQAQRATCILSNYGINERTGVVATWETELTNAATSFGSWPFIQATLLPVSTGAWTLVGGSDQTTDGSNAFRVSVNGHLRSGAISGLAGYVEVSDYGELVRDGGKWKADGTVGKYTTDGLHPSTYMHSQIVISPSIIPVGPFLYMPLTP